MLVLQLLKGKWKWTPVTVFWVEAQGLIGCTLLAVFMWLSAKANFKMQEKEALAATVFEKASVVIDAAGNPKKSKKSIVFPTEGQVAVTKKRLSTTSISDDVDREAMTNLNLIGQHLKVLFMNPIFIIVVVIGFCYDGTVVCFRYCYMLCHEAQLHVFGV